MEWQYAPRGAEGTLFNPQTSEGTDKHRCGRARGSQVLKTIPEAALGCLKTQTLKLDRPGFEFGLRSLLHVCPWTHGLSPLNLHFIFWATEGIICPQRTMLSKCTSQVPRTQQLGAGGPARCTAGGPSGWEPESNGALRSPPPLPAPSSFCSVSAALY